MRMTLGNLSGGIPFHTITPSSQKLFRAVLASYGLDGPPFGAGQIEKYLNPANSPYLSLSYNEEIRGIVKRYISAPIPDAAVRAVMQAMGLTDQAARAAISKNRKTIADLYAPKQLSFDTALKILAGTALAYFGATALANAASAAGTAAGSFTGGAVLPGTPVASFGAGTGVTAGAGAASVGSGTFVSTAAGSGITLKSVALSTLKKLAIDKGTEIAVQYAATEYAKREQKKMSEQMERELAAELDRARNEYATLTATGTTPAVAASQAAGDSGKLPVALIAGAILLGILFLRR